MWRNQAASLSTALLANSDHYLWMLTLFVPFGLACLLTGEDELTSKHMCARKPAGAQSSIAHYGSEWENSRVPWERTAIKL